MDFYNCLVVCKILNYVYVGGYVWKIIIFNY